MSLSVCSRNDCVARVFAASLCLQTPMGLGGSRTSLVVAGLSWDSTLPSKAQTCFLARLQTLACIALRARL